MQLNELILKYGITVRLIEELRRSVLIVGVKFCRAMSVLKCYWSVYEKGRHPLFSINVLIGYFSSDWPASISRTLTKDYIFT